MHVEHRTFILDRRQASPADSPDSVDEPEDRLSYAGILLSYLQDDVVDREMWLPMGEAPTLTDDEALIAAMHMAMRWNRGELHGHLKNTSPEGSPPATAPGGTGGDGVQGLVVSHLVLQRRL